MNDPFKPTFGASPPLLAGRDQEVRDFASALDGGPGSAGRATLYTGARGSGKTVMLNAIEDEARSRGWIVVSETSTEDLIETLTQGRLPALLRHFDPDAVRRRFNEAKLPIAGGGVGWNTFEAHMLKVDLRDQIELLTGLLGQNQTGLLITVDEIHRNQVAALRKLAIVVQHAFRENRELAFVGAGLASSISDLLNEDVLTFLRRADRHVLGPVALAQVRQALVEPIEKCGRGVDFDALEIMVEGTHGYPFLIQLVGSHCWRVTPSSRSISSADASIGVENAHRRLGALVHAPALTGASDVDKSFLLAMAQDAGPSRMGDITRRLGVDKEYAGVYRSRLIASELIEPVRFGYVDFTLPFLREYLKDHAASGI